MAAPSVPRYVISRYSDVIFAVFIGCSAALVRIRKEETEKRSGLPSASMVITPQQKERMVVEKEEMRKRVRKSKLEMYKPRVGGDEGEDGSAVSPPAEFEDGWWGSGREEYGRGVKKVEVGNLEVLRMFWERMVWKVDYEWNGRVKEVERTDGRLV